MVGVRSSTGSSWRLAGEGILGWVGGGLASSLRPLLPRSVRPLPGLPAALVAVSYSSSPVGPFCELSVAVPARLGLRPGLCVVFQVVSVADARLAYRTQWGTPASLVPSMVWDVGDGGGAGGVRELRCPSLGLVVRGEPVGPSVPAGWVPVRSIQRRPGDGPVVVPRRLGGLVRLARVSVTWSELASPLGSTVDELLASLAGEHRGAMLAGMRLLVLPVRHPTGLWSSLRAPAPVPELGVRTTTVASRTGRLAQLVRAQPSHG